MSSSALMPPPPPPPSSKPDSLATINLDGITIDHDSDDDFQDAQDSASLAYTEEDDDAPPAFPSLNSAQRQSAPNGELSSSAKANAVADILSKPIAPSGLMAPPAARGLAVPRAGAGGIGGLMVPPSTSALTAPPGIGGASGATLNKAEKRKKVALAPGCSPLDWARLKKTTDLRGGVTTLLRVTPSELKKHNTREDAWSAFYGKVYNITPYLRFHPGGEDDLMRVAGRDGTRLFALTHSWVNIDAMIDSAMVGILSSE